MPQGSNTIGKIQGGIVALLLGYFLLRFFNVFPTDNIADGPFSDAYWIISLMPWMLVLLGVVILISMVVEVANL